MAEPFYLGQNFLQQHSPTKAGTQRRSSKTVLEPDVPKSCIATKLFYSARKLARIAHCCRNARHREGRTSAFCTEHLRPASRMSSQNVVHRLSMDGESVFNPMFFYRCVCTRTSRWRFITGIAFPYPGGVHQSAGCLHQMTFIITEGSRNAERCESRLSYHRFTASDIEVLVNKSTEERITKQV